MEENKNIARKGGNAGKQARFEIEKETGEAIVSANNSKSLLAKPKENK